MNIIATRLYELRTDHDLLQKQVASLLGISQQYYSAYEKGKNELPIHHLKTLCIYYHISADYILGLIDQQRPF